MFEQKQKEEFDSHVADIKEVIAGHPYNATVKLPADLCIGLGDAFIKELAKDGLLLWKRDKDWFVAPNV